MEQTVYTQVSKEIGLEGTATIPTLEEAHELLKKVENEDIDAFTEIFKIYRFVTSPTDSTLVKVMRVITEAFYIGSIIFRNRKAK